MKVIINGKNNDIKSKDIAALLDELNINPIGRLVELNGKIIHWTKYGSVSISENDNIEILQFTGGG
jgi:thiamine biosynthesis protein ThiS